MEYVEEPFTESSEGRELIHKEQLSVESKADETGTAAWSMNSVRSSKACTSKPFESMSDGMIAKGTSSTATASRERKGSLRKAAMAKMRSESSIAIPPHSSITTPSQASADQSTPNNKSFLSPAAAPASDHSHDRQRLEQLSSTSSSITKSPYASTTEEEEAMSFQRPTVSRSTSSFDTRGQTSTTSTLLRRSHRSASRALPQESPTSEDLDYEDEWDYSETERWGWVILIATWVVFVVVMGSCFGVWSWAWDVGETPYAPPDLEDDDTLPITGYYPALMVCTAVMSWVWVVVAWVGMKYFRHAKVVADDG
jgi:hypothetical protein